MRNALYLVPPSVMDHHQGFTVVHREGEADPTLVMRRGFRWIFRKQRDKGRADRGSAFDYAISSALNNS